MRNTRPSVATKLLSVVLTLSMLACLLPVLSLTALGASTLGSIEVTKLPDKTVYKQDDHLELSGWEVTATFDVGSPASVTSLVQTNPIEGATLSSIEQMQIEVSYSEDNGQTSTKTSFNVMVLDRSATLTGLAVTALPLKTSYNMGEALDLTGIEVTASFTSVNNVVTLATVTGFTLERPEEATLTSIGPKVITVSYTFYGMTMTAEFNVYVYGLKGLTVKAPTKTEYTIGEPLDLTGMEVTAEYEFSQSASVTSIVTTRPANGATLNILGDQKIEVSYNDSTATETALFYVKVKAPLTGLDVTKPPTKTIYRQFEALDTTGIVVTATYGNDSIESTATVTGFTTSPQAGESLTLIGEYQISVDYTERGAMATSMFKVTVIATSASLTSIEIASPPVKTSYTVGDRLDLAGLVVTATFDTPNGNVTATLTSFTTTPADGATLTSVNQQAVTVTYVDKGVPTTTSFPIIVNSAPAVLAGITVTNPPTKTGYYVGETLDLTGMVVTATYIDGSTASVTSIVTTRPAKGATLTSADQTVTVTYSENNVSTTTSFPITVHALNATITGISIASPPTKTVYTVGENLDTTGLVVIASYDDSTTSTLASFTISPANGTALDTAGNVTVTVSYLTTTATFTATFEVTVNSGSSGGLVPPVTGPSKPDVGAAVVLPGGAGLSTPAGSDPVVADDGTITLPGGGTVKTESGTKIDLPSGTTISGGKISVPKDSGGAKITLKSGLSFKIVEDSEIILDEDTPLGYFVSAKDPFEDVKEPDWFYDDVMFVYTHDLMVGTSMVPRLFSPNAPITRAMVVTVLYRMTGSPDVSELKADDADVAFTDIVEGSWYYDAVIWAAANKIVVGHGNGKFGPNDVITRQDLAMIFLNYENFSGKVPPDVVADREFADWDTITDYAKNAVNVLTTQDIIRGKPGGIFDPKGRATRAEFATMLARFIYALEKA